MVRRLRRRGAARMPHEPDHKMLSPATYWADADLMLSHEFSTPALNEEAMSDAQNVDPELEAPAEDKRFRHMWRQLFGDAAVQVYFADSELNARVYTLDGESGYKVQHKKVGGTNPIEEPEDLASQRLAFPKKARRGEKHGRAQLGEDDVRAIRAWAADLALKNRIPSWTAKAKELNVSEGTLRDIVSRRTWTHLSSDVPALPKRVRLEQHEIDTIREWAAEEKLKSGAPDWFEKAKEFGISDKTIRAVAARLTWAYSPSNSRGQPKTMLTESDVQAIRDWATEMKKNGAVLDYAGKSREFNVAESTIRCIVTRRSWKQLPGGLPGQARTKLTESDVRAIREWATKMKESGTPMDCVEKGKEFNVTGITIRRVIAGRSWADLD